MQKLIYILSFIAIAFGLSGISFPLGLELIIALVLVGVLGLSHGAVDHILAVKSVKIFHPNKTVFFISLYLLIIGVYLGIWMILPFLSFVFFLLYSAYHFGQADTDSLATYFSDLNLKWVQISWGLIIIAALVYFNASEITAMTPEWLALKVRLTLITDSSLPLLIVSFLSLLLALSFLTVYPNPVAKKLIYTKLIHLFVILMVFVSLPFITSFSIYFGLWHALPVLSKEYKILTKADVVHNTFEFSKLLLPFTLISLGFIIFLIIVSKQYAVYNTLIAISTLALPHTMLMHKLYSNEKLIAEA